MHGQSVWVWVQAQVENICRTHFYPSEKKKKETGHRCDMIFEKVTILVCNIFWCFSAFFKSIFHKAECCTPCKSLSAWTTQSKLTVRIRRRHLKKKEVCTLSSCFLHMPLMGKACDVLLYFLVGNQRFPRSGLRHNTLGKSHVSFSVNNPIKYWWCTLLQWT